MTPAFCPERMTRSEAFRRACQRNAIRRAGKLPLLGISEAVDEELRREAIHVHYAAAEHYRSDFEQIQSRVVAELCNERGSGFSDRTSGRWISTLRSNREFAAFLASEGFARPVTAMIPYGTGRAKAAISRNVENADLDQLPG